jgi:hypothetical protein
MNLKYAVQAFPNACTAYLKFIIDIIITSMYNKTYSLEFQLQICMRLQGLKSKRKRMGICYG